jgi:hypothetical protein
MYNPNFNSPEFEEIKNAAGSNNPATQSQYIRIYRHLGTGIQPEF